MPLLSEVENPDGNRGSPRVISHIRLTQGGYTKSELTSWPGRG
jgi:hypothetical protein